jgi:hypothetical protein
MQHVIFFSADGTIEIWNSDNDWYQEMVNVLKIFL